MISFNEEYYLVFISAPNRVLVVNAVEERNGLDLRCEWKCTLSAMLAVSLLTIPCALLRLHLLSRHLPNGAGQDDGRA
jgi:hypothetical protein